MTEATGAFSSVAETASQLITGEAIHAALSCDNGGRYSIFVSCEKSVVRDLCITAVSLYGIYTTSKLIARAIDGIVNRGLGGPRKDQDIGKIRPGSLHVELQCLTDERFLEVWTDYESGRMKERLQEEFSQSGIAIEGLKIEIENLEEVNRTMMKIETRRCLRAQKTLDAKDEENMKGKDVNEKLEEMNKKLGEIEENQQRIEHNIKEDLQNLKREIIDQIRGSGEQFRTDRTISINKTTSRRRVRTSQPASYPKEVIILGGRNKHKTISSVEKAELGQGDIVWVALAPMTVARYLAASVVIGKQIIVVGGGTDSIETLDVDQCPLRWIKSEAVLPCSLFGHQTVVYQGKLIVIGGYNASKGTYSDEIHEVLLTSPYSSKLLCKLPKPIGNHGAEMVKNKIYIFGGKTDGLLYDEVLIYDPVRNECKVISKLPYPLRYMSTVQLEDKVILIGGERENDIPLKEVIMYDTVADKSTMLPSMNHSRRACSAVINGDVILVMGGYDNKAQIRSVECYDVSNKTWRDLPSMKEARGHATAVICPKF